MVRGINKSAIFTDDQDKIRFLDRLGQTTTEGQGAVYAWVLINEIRHLDYGYASSPADRDKAIAALRATLPP